MSDIPQLNTLLSPRFLFQFAVPLKRHTLTGPNSGAKLDESFRLPDLAGLDRETPASERRFADVRMAWAPEGLALTVQVAGKQQPVWCRDSRLEDSDGVQVWIDTRATHNVHRATKFCHRFVFLPAGAGRESGEAVADQLLVNRARENARPVRPRELQVAGRVSATGWGLAAFLSAAALGGYDPEQHKKIGFNYAISDREFGLQTFSNGITVPFFEDPSTWATLELMES